MKALKNVSLVLLIYSSAGTMTLLADEIAKHPMTVMLVMSISAIMYFFADVFDD